MSPLEIGILGVILLFVLIALQMHIGVAMGLVALVGIALITNPEAALTHLANNAYRQTSSPLMSVIPLFFFSAKCFFNYEPSVHSGSSSCHTIIPDCIVTTPIHLKIMTSWWEPSIPKYI